MDLPVTDEVISLSEQLASTYRAKKQLTEMLNERNRNNHPRVLRSALQLRLQITELLLHSLKQEAEIRKLSPAQIHQIAITNTPLDG